MQTPKLSVIIVSYNSEAFIEKCLTSLQEDEIIVFDNASSDRTIQIIKKFTNIKLIKSSENLGFAKANNKAAEEAKGEYLFFLNPDTEVEKPLDELVNFYENTPNAGIVGPKLVLENGAIQPSARKLPTIMGAFKEYILGVKNAYSQYIPGGKPTEVEMVYGAAILIKKDLFERLGGFDEKFFLYYEDVDLCKRVKNLGKKIYYYPKVTIKHLVGATKSGMDKNKLNMESAVKYHGKLGAFILQLIFLIPRLRRHL